MPPVCTRSASSAFVNREGVVDELRHAARKLKEEHPEVLEVFCFGSFASGTPTPRSDADVLVIVADSDIPPRQRGPLFADAFLRTCVPVDLFVFTAPEFERAQEGVAAAARRGLRLV